MSELARIGVEDRGGHRVASVAGEVDASNAEDVKARLVEALPNSALGLVADLRTLEYLDSSGVAIFFELADRLARRGQALVLVVDTDALIRPTLELTGVGSVAALATTPEEAAALLKRPA